MSRQIENNCEAFAKLRKHHGSYVASNATDPGGRDGSDVLALGCRSRVETVGLVGFDGYFGTEWADGAGERHHVHDRWFSIEDSLSGYEHRWVAEASLAALGCAEFEVYDFTRGQH